MPAGLTSGATSETGLGSYASSLLDPIASMTNWASSLASGGNASQIGSFASSSIQTGPLVQFPGGGQGGWYSSFDPSSGLITFTNSRDPGQTFVQGINQSVNPSGYGEFGDLPPSLISQWTSDYNQNQQQKQTAGIQPGVGQAAAQSSMGPFLGQAWGDLQQAQAATGQLAPIQAQTAASEAMAMSDAATLGSEGQSLYQTGVSELNQATTGTGLFPSQKAMIDEAVSSEQTNIDSSLAGMGLSNSTQKAQLEGQASLAGAATAGGLVQGNISAAQGTISAAQNQINLGQAAQKLAVGAQTLEVGEQSALVSELTQISSQSAQIQAQLWSQAMQGYGALGTIIGQSAQSYGYSLQGYGSILQAETQQANNQVSLETEQAKADAQSTSSLFSGLGSILGGSSSNSQTGQSSSSGLSSIIGIVETVLSFL